MRPTIGRHGTGALARWEDLASDQGGLIERWRRILVLTTIGSIEPDDGHRPDRGQDQDAAPPLDQPTLVRREVLPPGDAWVPVLP